MQRLDLNQIRATVDRYCRRAIDAGVDAEDIVGDVALHLLERMSERPENVPWLVYLASVARTRANMRARRLVTRERHQHAPRVRAHQDPPGAGLARTLAELAQRVDEDDRPCLELLAFGHNSREIARLLGESWPIVQARVARIRAALKTQPPSCLSPAAHRTATADR